MGANKNTIKIIGEETDLNVQGYFVYDSKKSGAVTTSHLRFSKQPIRSTYLISRANFVACHQFSFMERLDVLKAADPGAVFLLNSPFGPDEVWDNLPRSAQQTIIEKKLRFYVIDAVNGGPRGRHGRPHQHRDADLLLRHQRRAAARGSHRRHQALHREDLWQARRVDCAQELRRSRFRARESARSKGAADDHRRSFEMRPAVPANAPDFVRNVEALMITGDGDQIPVSAMPIDGTFPTGTTKWEKRNIALEIPVWDEELCIQCGKCVMVCPHAVIRAKVYDPHSHQSRSRGLPDRGSQVARILRAEVHAASRARRLHRLRTVRRHLPGQEQERSQASRHQHGAAAAAAREVQRVLGLLPVDPRAVARQDFARPGERRRNCWSRCLSSPAPARVAAKLRTSQLMTHLFGDRALIANATGCSSIYGGNLPTTPYTVNAEGRGPAWSNSLFEDNAEFGMGMRLAVDKQNEYAKELVERLASTHRRRTRRQHSRCRSVHRRRHLRPARAREGAERKIGWATSLPRLAICWRLPTSW